MGKTVVNKSKRKTSEEIRNRTETRGMYIPINGIQYLRRSLVFRL